MNLLGNKARPAFMSRFMSPESALNESKEGSAEQECKSSSEEVEISVMEREWKTADVSDSDIFESQSMLSGQVK